MNVFSRSDGIAQPVPADRHASDDHLTALSRLALADACVGVGSTPEGLTASEPKVACGNPGST